MTKNCLTIFLLSLAVAFSAGVSQAQPLDFDPGKAPNFTPEGSPPAVNPGTPPSINLVPELAVAFFGHDLFKFPGSKNRTSQWYFSFTFKSIYHFTGDNWFFFEEFGAFLYLSPTSGSLADGFWAYLSTPTHATWVYMARDNNFYDLRDSNKDGTNDLDDTKAGNQTMSGYLFVHEPFPGDPAGSEWYYFSQYPSGNWIVNMGISNPTSEDWHKLR